jgi:hypothetical protein
MKKLFLIAILLVISMQNSFANDCNINTSLAQKNEFRVDGGFTPVDGPVTEGSVNTGCGNFDVFVWDIHNNNSGEVNEIDFGIGYLFKLKSLSGRIDIERWEYTEAGDKNHVLVANINYNRLPVSLVFKVSQFIYEDGTQLTTSVSKDIEIGTVKGFTLKLTPQAKFTYLGTFFGVTVYSNDVYSLTLNGVEDNLSINMLVNQHDGHEGSSNYTQYAVGVSYSF